MTAPVTTTLRAALLLLAFVLAAPSGASADAARSLRIADAYWGPHPCAGKTQVVFDATLADRGFAGEALGVVGTVDAWHVESCRISIVPGMPDEDECYAIAHEVGHLVHGPAHTGRMSYASDGPHACYPPLRTQIRRALPAPRAQWRITCRPSSARTRCHARSPRARYARSFVASVAPDGYVRWLYER